MNQSVSSAKSTVSHRRPYKSRGDSNREIHPGSASLSRTSRRPRGCDTRHMRQTTRMNNPRPGRSSAIHSVRPRRRNLTDLLFCRRQGSVQGLRRARRNQAQDIQREDQEGDLAHGRTWGKGRPRSGSDPVPRPGRRGKDRRTNSQP